MTQKLEFNISDTPVIIVSLDGQAVRTIEIFNEFAADILLPQDKRNFAGLVSQLRYFDDSNKTFDEFVNEMRQRPFRTDIHPNLTIEVTEDERVI